MAIRRKEEKSRPSLPVEIEATVDRALEAKYLSEYFEGKKKDLMGEAVRQIENDSRVELVIGEGLKSRNGMVVLMERRNFDVDAAAIEAAVAEGLVSVADLVACVSTWKKDRLGEVLPGAMAEKDPTRITQLRVQPHFEAQMQAKHQELDAFWLEVLAQVREEAA